MFLIQPSYTASEAGWPSYPLKAGLRVHLLQNWLRYSDPAMDEALCEMAMLLQFSGLSLERIPEKTTILHFRRLLEKHNLVAGILEAIISTLAINGCRCAKGRLSMPH